jgi:hypothetical protein
MAPFLYADGSITYDSVITHDNTTSLTYLGYEEDLIDTTSLIDTTRNVLSRWKYRYAGYAGTDGLWSVCDSTSDTSWYAIYGDKWWYETPGPKSQLREIIRSRQSPTIITRKPAPTVTDIREVRARETLFRVLGEEKFRRFLKHGFVSVRAKSGLVYQIFPGHDFTNVYQDGVKIERLCVVFKGNFPPTDSLIMRYLLILNDEREFRRHANEFMVTRRIGKPVIKKIESLPEAWRRLRAVA